MLTDEFAKLRAREFARLDATDTVYLDFTGAALYPASLVNTHAAQLAASVLGNPHSLNAPSLESADAIEAARELILRFFDADPEIYDVVFTANATAAIRILSETFPFRNGSRFVLTADNHNSVNGLWLRALRCGVQVDYIPLDAELRAYDPRPWLERAPSPSVFAFPAQSNFSGVQHPLEWIGMAQDAGYRVLLDAASFAPTNPLSLASAPADFVAVSFYKIFGYPPGVGALIARRDALSILQREYFGGGTVEFVSVSDRTVRSKPGAARFEDGTPPFLAMPAVINGLRWMEELGVLSVKRHVSQLTSELLGRLRGLNDRVLIYGPHDTKARGGIVAFNLVRDGLLLNYEDVEACARASGIAVRSGCFCNPGAAEYAFAAQDRMDLRPGCLRASVGIPTTTADIDRLLTFVTELTSRHLSPTLPSSARAPARPPDMA